MFLEPWMIAVIVLSFGLCGWFSSASGRRSGGLLVLDTLVEKRIIMIKDGELKPYSVWNNPEGGKAGSKSVGP